MQLSIDTDQEEIVSNKSENLNGDAARLQENISSKNPNYHLFHFSYRLKGKQMKKKCFIYSIPTEAEIPIKVDHSFIIKTCVSAENFNT